MLRLYHATASPDIPTRWKAYEVFNYASTANYMYLSNYVPLLVQRTLQALPTEEDSVAIQMLLVWTSIAEMEDALEERNAPHHGFVAAQASALVPLFLETLSKSTDPNLVEIEISPPRSPHTAAMLTLWAFTRVVPEEVIVPLFASFIGRYLPTTCKSWSQRKAAIAAVGLLSSFDSAETLIVSSIGLIVDAGIYYLDGTHITTESQSQQTTSKATEAISSENVAMRSLSISETASFAIQRISESWPTELDDRWGDIVLWMSKLDVTKKDEYIILGNLLGHLINSLSYDEDGTLLEIIEPHVKPLLNMFETWTSKKEILRPVEQCRLLMSAFESLTDLCKDNLAILDAEKVEGTCLNTLELIETNPYRYPKILSSIWGTFNPTIFAMLSLPSAARAIRTVLTRAEQTESMEELQDAFILLTGATEMLKDKFAPYLDQTFNLIIHVLEKKGVFMEGDEFAIIPVSELLPDDEISSDEEGADLDEVVTEAAASQSSKPETRLLTPQQALSTGLQATSISTLSVSGEHEKKSGFGGRVRTQRQEEVRKSLAVSAKNVAVEDALKAVEHLMNSISPEHTSAHVNALQVCMLQLALRVPASFTSVLTSIAMALASTIRAHSETANIYFSPLIKLLEKVTKTALASNEPGTSAIYPSLLNCYSSAALSVLPNNEAHSKLLVDILEPMLALIKASMKDEIIYSLQDDMLPHYCAVLIGDFIRATKPKDKTIIQRLLSTFELVLEKWEEPDRFTIDYVSKYLQNSNQE